VRESKKVAEKDGNNGMMDRWNIGVLGRFPTL
jgi:hypothetical protein